MTITNDIIERAKAYPERVAIADLSGRVVRYAGIAEELATTNAAYRFGSSATTGKQKFVILTDEQMRTRIARFSSDGRQGLLGLKVLLSAVPLTAAVGRAIYLHCLLEGMTFLAASWFVQDMAKWDGFCKEYGADGLTMMAKPNIQVSVAERLLETDTDYRFANIYLVGNPVPQAQRRALQDRHGGTVYLNYGTTEAGPAIAETTLDVTDANPNIVGKPCSDLDVDIDADGFIRFRGFAVAESYDGDPEATARCFRDGWFYPGDRAHFEGENLVIDGRG